MPLSLAELEACTHAVRRTSQEQHDRVGELISDSICDELGPDIAAMTGLLIIGTAHARGLDVDIRVLVGAGIALGAAWQREQDRQP